MGKKDHLLHCIEGVSIVWFPPFSNCTRVQGLLPILLHLKADLLTSATGRRFSIDITQRSNRICLDRFKISYWVKMNICTVWRSWNFLLGDTHVLTKRAVLNSTGMIGAAFLKMLFFTLSSSLNYFTALCVGIKLYKIHLFIKKKRKVCRNNQDSKRQLAHKKASNRHQFMFI